MGKAGIAPISTDPGLRNTNRNTRLQLALSINAGEVISGLESDRASLHKSL